MEPQQSRQSEAGPQPDSPQPAAPGTPAAPNYQYWQQHGDEWVKEYDTRKLTRTNYHIQELMLTDYAARLAAAAPERPIRVLEFGCGVGRHLRNLDQLPGVEAHGYDQSPTMVRGCLRWTGQSWIDQRVTIGPPTGRLPYDDASFDLVYSTEVLVHVRPEDLDGILSELLRISRGEVLHIEPSEHIRIAPVDHNGCWNHDLVAAYARLGRECRVLPAGYEVHQPFRVLVGYSEPRADLPPAVLALYRRMEQDLGEGFRVLRTERDSHLADAQLHAARADSLQAAGAQAQAAALALEQSAAAERQSTAAALADVTAQLDRERQTVARLTDLAAATQAALDTAAAELQRTRAESTGQIERLTADLASSRSALEQDRADLASAHRRIEALEAEVFRLRESLARQLRVNTRTAAAAATELAGEKRRTAGAAWARESMVQRLNHALERR